MTRQNGLLGRGAGRRALQFFTASVAAYEENRFQLAKQGIFVEDSFMYRLHKRAKEVLTSPTIDYEEFNRLLFHMEQITSQNYRLN